MALARAAARRQRELEKLEEKKASSSEIVTLKEGDGVNFPKSGDSLSFHYTTALEDGTQIDDSYARGPPMHVVLGAGTIVAGLEEAFPHLSEGQKARITVPAALAYGDKGHPPIIPSNSKLVFEIELLLIHTDKCPERYKK